MKNKCVLCVYVILFFINKYKMTEKICLGDGSCLVQTDFKNGYEKDTNVECRYECEPIKCSNFIICGTSTPLREFQCHAGLCIYCDMMFGAWQGGCGELKFKNDVECCICLETKTGVSYPKCDHYVCVTCFKRCFYGVEHDEDDGGEEEDKDEEENLKKCPLCRK